APGTRRVLRRGSRGRPGEAAQGGGEVARGPSRRRGAAEVCRAPFAGERAVGQGAQLSRSEPRAASYARGLRAIWPAADTARRRRGSARGVSLRVGAREPGRDAVVNE